MPLWDCVLIAAGDDVDLAGLQLQLQDDGEPGVDSDEDDTDYDYHGGLFVRPVAAHSRVAGRCFVWFGALRRSTR